MGGVIEKRVSSLGCMKGLLGLMKGRLVRTGTQTDKTAVRWLVQTVEYNTGPEGMACTLCLPTCFVYMVYMCGFSVLYCHHSWSCCFMVIS